MTGQEGLNLVNLFEMFYAGRERASERKLRFLACGLCRYLWDWLTDPRSRRAVETAERFADGEAETEELNRAHEEANRAMECFEPNRCSNELHSAREMRRKKREAAFAVVEATFAKVTCQNIVFHVCYAAVAAAEQAVWEPADKAKATADEARGKPGVRVLRSAATEAREAACRSVGAARRDAASRAMDYQEAILRDVFGPLPSGEIRLAPAWLTWNDGTIRKLAQAVYAERLLPEGQLDKARLAILADALEEAGCTDPDLLGHLRGPGPHVRGCWAVDLLHGKA